MKDRINKLLHKANRLVIKVGTSTLTHETGKLNLYQMEVLVREIVDLKNQGREVILVTSGAVGAGMGRMGLTEKPRTMPEKQALAAIGQGLLLHMYEKLFAEYGQIASQVLLTKDDISNRERYLNSRNTLSALLRMGTVPIINENDTVVFEQIKFGDNDTLAALVSGLVNGDLLIVLSDIEGLYTCNPKVDKNACLIELVEEITPEIEKLAGEPGSKLGSGGMITKIEAAKIACNSGIPMVLANGKRPNVLRDIVTGLNPGTIFIPKDHPLKTRKGWIAYGSIVDGVIRVDPGAEKALVSNGKSLLPSGISSVEGHFSRGSVVKICGVNGEIARGIVNYGSEEITKIKGCQSKDIAEILGHKDYEEIIHRDNLCLTS